MTDAITPDHPVDVPDPATLSYEQARDELVRVVGRLEAGGEPLEVSLALWERGEALAARCQEWLDGARERLAAAQAGAAASPTALTPDDVEEDE
ncbi:exodeoxyribonuclease VII small subunit [Isoptericola variabilis]|uniref:Exodeoxyribonuclease 7 small subunit n=1 Tax=Isoptericola variabilis (strain 225) TaxID=743718 RepID=F6FPH7_ISOV2|nr:exodeoxyribonuclease VII small subunit [Isoptericola variabilis]AEG43690.1 Exodeoxyribonuclease 7 small subunit [Isoptericola variabilis 225]